MMSSVIAGFGLGLSLIVAIGAQNLFVLRQGIRRQHVFAVALICAVSDAVLIAFGVSGVGLVLQSLPWLIDLVRWAGALFLATYAVLAARRALKPSGAALRADAAAPASSVVDGPSGRTSTLTARTGLAPVVLTCLALTWLNPHVYLDTVFLLGSIASTHGDARWLFAAGAMTASVCWFFALAYGARHLGRWLSTPTAWRVLDGIIALVMMAIAISLLLPR